MIRRLMLCAAFLALAGCSDTVPVDLASAGAGTSGSRLCMPVDDEGMASFAWESIENTADTNVTVVDVTVDDDTVEVTEWFLVAEDWPKAGVSRGPLTRPGAAKLPTVLPSGGRALQEVVPADQTCGPP